MYTNFPGRVERISPFIRFSQMSRSFMRRSDVTPRTWTPRDFAISANTKAFDIVCGGGVCLVSNVFHTSKLVRYLSLSSPSSSSEKSLIRCVYALNVLGQSSLRRVRLRIFLILWRKWWVLFVRCCPEPKDTKYDAPERLVTSSQKR